jgi:hypothetical protein
MWWVRLLLWLLLAMFFYVLGSMGLAVYEVGRWLWFRL